MYGIKKLFEFIIIHATWFNMLDEPLDGLTEWRKIKYLLDHKTTFEWSAESQEINLTYYGDNAEITHFCEKITGIPKNEKLTVRKLIQVAFNIGQYSAYMGDLDFDDIEFFASEEAIDAMDKIITDNKVYESVVAVLDR